MSTNEDSNVSFSPSFTFNPTALLFLPTANLHTTPTMKNLLLALVAVAVSTTTAFLTPTQTAGRTISSSARDVILPTDFVSSTADAFHDGATSLLLSDEALSPAVEAARQKFWFYFFAGSGAGGIGIAQLPAIFRDASGEFLCCDMSKCCMLFFLCLRSVSLLASLI